MKWTKFRKEKTKYVNILHKLYKRLESEAVFPQEVAEYKELKTVIDFINRIDYNSKWEKAKCPVCNAISIIKSEPTKINLFDRNGTFDRNSTVIIHYCEKCGYTTLEELENESKS